MSSIYVFLLYEPFPLSFDLVKLTPELSYHSIKKQYFFNISLFEQNSCSLA